jgi:hypothetical protein
MEAPRKAQSASAINCEQSEFHGIHLSTEEVQRKCRRVHKEIALTSAAKFVRLCGGG